MMDNFVYDKIVITFTINKQLLKSLTTIFLSVLRFTFLHFVFFNNFIFSSFIFFVYLFLLG